MKVLIVGTGAIGGFYGALLDRQGAEVSVVCRSDYATVRDGGIRIHSPLGNWIFRPHRVLRDIGEAGRDHDYLLLCTKILEGMDRAAMIREAVGPHTAITLIQNGVEIEAPLAERFPDHELISGLAFVCVSRTAPGVIWHQAYGRLAFGNYPGGCSERVRSLCTRFEAAGVPATATEDIVAARWQKCIWNAPFNPLSVISGGLRTADILGCQEPYVRAVMEEVSAVAAACGHPVPAGTIDRNIDHTRAMPPYKTSMLLDHEAGRPLETEAILGNAVRAARRVGVSTPRLESLYTMLKLIEYRLAQPL